MRIKTGPTRPRGFNRKAFTELPKSWIHEAFQWKDASWRGLSLEDYIIYEVHVGTYSTEGTFDAIIPYLDGMKELGSDST